MDEFSIVFVCSGNRFRSPLAEAFVRQLTIGLPVKTASFGTLRLGSAPALPEALELGLSCGVDLSNHLTRVVDAESLATADLVIGFEPQHVHRAVVDAAAPRRRSFTFHEIVAGLENVQVSETMDVLPRAREVVEQAARSRDVDSPSAVALSIPDPYGKSWRVYRETAAEVRELSLRLVQGLFGLSGTSVLPAFPPTLGRQRFRRRR